MPRATIGQAPTRPGRGLESRGRETRIPSASLQGSTTLRPPTANDKPQNSKPPLGKRGLLSQFK